jgi:hypothetical protein
MAQMLANRARERGFMKRTFFLAGLALSFLVIPAKATTVQTSSDYSVEEVKQLLKQPHGFSSSFSEKQNQRLGDRVSIALIKMFTPEELANPENVKRFLPLIVEAFQSPAVAPPNDREPRVTELLLKFLETRVPALQGEIQKAESSVQQSVRRWAQEQHPQ